MVNNISLYNISIYMSIILERTYTLKQKSPSLTLMHIVILSSALFALADDVYSSNRYDRLWGAPPANSAKL